MTKHTLRISLILCLCLTGFAQQSFADWNYTFIPAASLNLEYDSNIYFTSRDEKSDFNYHGSVVLPFHATSAASDFAFSYRTSRFQYTSERSANYGNHFLDFSASHTVSPRLHLSLTDRYSITKDSDRILRSGSIEGETGIIAERSKRKSNSITGGIDYALTKRSSLSLSGTNSFYRYSPAERYDTKTNGGNLSYNYVLNPKNTLFTTVSYFNSDYSRDSRQLRENALYAFNGLFNELLFSSEFDRSRNTSAYIGITHRFSPTLETTLYAGTRRTKNTTLVLHLKESPGNSVIISNASPNSFVQYTLTKSDGSTARPLELSDSTGTLTISDAEIATMNDSEKTSGLVYSLNITKSFSTSSLILGFSQDVTTRTTFGGTTERQGYQASYTYRFSDRLSANFNGRYDKNTQESDIRDDNYKTLRLGIASTFAITRRLSSRLSWDHTKQKRDIEGTVNIRDTDRDLILLTFTYEWPLIH